MTLFLAYYYSSDDYEKLLRFYLDKKDQKILSALLSSEFIRLWSNIPGQGLFAKTTTANNEATLYEIQFKILLEFIESKQDDKATNILMNVSGEKLNLNRKMSIHQIKSMLPGATLLQIAIKNNQLEVADLLIKCGASIATMDYYYNSSLHYGGMGGKVAYEYVKKAGIESSSNIFNLTPLDLLEQAHKLPIIGQGLLTEQFMSYMKLNKYDEQIIFEESKDKKPFTGKDIIEDFDKGVCQGITFIFAIYALRGKKSLELYYKMLEFIRTWDGTMSSLNDPVTDEELAKDFKSRKNIFEYLMNTIMFFHRKSNLVVNIGDHDKTSQFQFVTNKKDELTFSSIHKCLEDRDAFIDLLHHVQLNKNVVFFITLDDPKQPIECCHQIGLVVDEENMLHFIDANAKYILPPMPNSSKSLEIISNIIYNYFIRVSVHVVQYQYHPEEQLTFDYKSPKP